MSVKYRIKLTDFEQTNPDFVADFKAMYAKRGWRLPEYVHVSPEGMKNDLSKNPKALELAKDYFDKHGVPFEKPREEKIIRPW